MNYLMIIEIKVNGELTKAMIKAGRIFFSVPKLQNIIF